MEFSRWWTTFSTNPVSALSLNWIERKFLLGGKQKSYKTSFCMINFNWFAFLKVPRNLKGQNSLRTDRSALYWFWVVSRSIIIFIIFSQIHFEDRRKIIIQATSNSLANLLQIDIWQVLHLHHHQIVMFFIFLQYGVLFKWFINWF